MQEIVNLNEIIKQEILEVIKNQINANDPPETKITYDRLIKAGYSEVETNQLIGQCVLHEIYKVVEDQEPFNEQRFKKNLENLPKEPIE